MKCVSAPILIWITAKTVFAADWGYKDVSEWGDLCKTGTQQSPIDLVDSETEIAVFSSFNFQGYNISNHASITNNNHSVAINMDGLLPIISGGGLIDEYVLNHIHFHWKSEHTVNGNRFPLEMHLVHFSKQHSTLQEAVKYVDGVAVLGVLFHQSLDHDEEFIPLVEAIEEVVRERKSYAEFGKKIAAKDFLPRDTADYYRYMGSLTTPNCNEGVIWTVFTNTLPISAEQVERFKSVALKDGPQTLNYRETQPLNGRSVLLRSIPAARERNLCPHTINMSLNTVLFFSMLSIIRSNIF